MVTYIPALYLYIIFDSIRNLLNSFKKFHIPNLVLFFSYTIHISWVYYFMVDKDLKMEGLGVARSITEGINVFLIVLIVYYLRKTTN